MLRIGILAPIVLDLVSLCTFESSCAFKLGYGFSRWPEPLPVGHFLSKGEAPNHVTCGFGFAGVEHIFWVKHDGVRIFCRMSMPTDTIDYMPMYIF